MSHTPSTRHAPAPAVELLLVAAPLAGSPLLAALFPGVAPTVVPVDALRVEIPWRGKLFELLAGAAAAGSPLHAAPGAAESPRAAPGAAGSPRAAPAVGLLVPVRWLSSEPAPEAVIVSDHVNLRLRGPLTGRRPVSGPRSLGPQPFPSPAGVYQPETIAGRVGDAVGRRVYSVVAVAGVARVADLTPFERRSVAAAGCPAACDCLVDAAIIAALHGLKIAACGVPDGRQPPTGRSS